MPRLYGCRVAPAHCDAFEEPPCADMQHHRMHHFFLEACYNAGTNFIASFCTMERYELFSLVGTFLDGS